MSVNFNECNSEKYLINNIKWKVKYKYGYDYK